jgi:hypothetical protein
VYDGYTFTGGSSVRGVIHIDYDVRNVTIRNSIVKAGPQNGITINADGGTEVRNIRFENVTVMSQPRMGFECTDRSSNGMWSGIDLVDMVFEPQGNQAISFDGPAGAGDSTVDNVTIKGAGTSSTQPWGNAFEINGPSNMTVRNCHFYQPRNHVLNLQRHSSRRATRKSFSDSTSWVASTATTRSSLRLRAGASPICLRAATWTGAPPRGATRRTAAATRRRRA